MARIKNGENPRDIKLELAKIITSLYHTKEEVNEAINFYNTAFTKKSIPDNIPSLNFNGSNLRDILDDLIKEKLVPSKKEFNRLLEQGGVQLNGEKIRDLDVIIKENDVLKIGKKRFLKLIR